MHGLFIDPSLGTVRQQGCSIIIVQGGWVEEVLWKEDLPVASVSWSSRTAGDRTRGRSTFAPYVKTPSVVVAPSSSSGARQIRG